MEQFSSCWGDRDYAYLAAVPDMPESQESNIPDLTTEQGAEAWIMSEVPETRKAFCNTSNVEILSQVLNDYDMETKDFYRWHVSYTRKALSDLIAKRSGEDIGLLESFLSKGRKKQWS